MISQFKPKDGDVAIIRLQGSSTASPSMRKENNFLDHLKELKKEDLDIQKELKQRSNMAQYHESMFHQIPKELQQSSALVIEKYRLAQLRKRELRKMREEMKKLPYVARRSYVKMFDLKQRTQVFKSQTTKFASKDAKNQLA